MAYTKDEFKQLVDDIQSQSWYKIQSDLVLQELIEDK